MRVIRTDEMSNRATTLKANEILPLKNDVMVTHYLSGVVRTNAGEFLRPH